MITPSLRTVGWGETFSEFRPSINVHLLFLNPLEVVSDENSANRAVMEQGLERYRHYQAPISSPLQCQAPHIKPPPPPPPHIKPLILDRQYKATTHHIRPRPTILSP